MFLEEREDRKVEDVKEIVSCMCILEKEINLLERYSGWEMSNIKSKLSGFKIDITDEHIEKIIEMKRDELDSLTMQLRVYL